MYHNDCICITLPASIICFICCMVSNEIRGVIRLVPMLVVLFDPQINSLFGMLDHLYAKFDKAHFAGLCKSLADGKLMGIFFLN